MRRVRKVIRLFIFNYDSFFYIEYDFPFHYFILWLCFVSISSHGICIGHSLAEGSREKQMEFYKALKSLSKPFHIRSRQHILLQNLRNRFPRQCAFWTPLGLMEEEWFFGIETQLVSLDWRNQADLWWSFSGMPALISLSSLFSIW